MELCCDKNDTGSTPLQKNLNPEEALKESVNSVCKSNSHRWDANIVIQTAQNAVQIIKNGTHLEWRDKRLLISIFKSRKSKN